MLLWYMLTYADVSRIVLMLLRFGVSLPLIFLYKQCTNILVH